MADETDWEWYRNKAFMTRLSATLKLSEALRQFTTPVATAWFGTSPTAKSRRPSALLSLRERPQQTDRSAGSSGYFLMVNAMGPVGLKAWQIPTSSLGARL